MKYTKEKLEQAALKSFSVRDVMREVGAPLTSGSSATHISNKLKEYKIDTSHFLGKRKNTGIVANNKKHWSQILTYPSTNKYKIRSSRLRQAMIESGIIHKCLCGIINTWNNKKIKLEIDHINGNCLDNRKENLRFLCPNCHSQTETFSISK